MSKTPEMPAWTRWEAATLLRLVEGEQARVTALARQARPIAGHATAETIAHLVSLDDLLAKVRAL